MIQNVRWLSVCLAVSIWGAAAGPTLALTPAEDAAIARAVHRGALIYAFDQAAWVTTDALMEKVPNFRKLGSKGGGWVIEPKGRLQHVVYYVGAKGDQHAVFWADAENGKVVESHVVAQGEDASLTPGQRQQILAREAAVRAGPRPCSPAPFNTVVLPPDAPGGPTPVYLLTAQVQAEVIPFGGHYEVEVGPDGKVASSRAFTKSCINMSAGENEQGGQPVAAAITHLLDPTPTEIHVWLSLWTGRPIYVITSDARVWEVQGDTITLTPEKADGTKAEP